MSKLNVNGRDHTVDADPATPILWALRDTLGMTGTKFGCGAALCGACTVHLDGQAIRSCITPISAAEGKKIITIEAATDGSDRVGAAVHAAWVKHDVAQCGYCQSGQIMSATAFLKSLPRGKQPTAAEIDAAMAGNICRCGTYARIRAAVADAAAPSPEGATMLPNFDQREMPRALQHLLARGQADDATALPRRSFLKLAGAGGLALGAFPHLATAQATDAAVGGLKPTQQPSAFVQIAPERRGHGHHQPAGVRPGRADRPADDPGRGARRRLAPGAQPQRLERPGLPRPALRHPPHRRLPLDQEQLHAVPRTRRARPRDAAVRGGSALERGRGQPAHAGRHGAGPGGPQGGLRRTGRGRDGPARAREGHAEEPQGLPHHRPPHHAPGCARQEQRATGLRHRHAPARSAHRRGGASAGVRRQARVAWTTARRAPSRA